MINQCVFMFLFFFFFFFICIGVFLISVKPLSTENTEIKTVKLQLIESESYRVIEMNTG